MKIMNFKFWLYLGLRNQKLAYTHRKISFKSPREIFLMVIEFWYNEVNS